MPDSVVDASVVAFSNGDIAGRRPGNALDRRLHIFEQVASGARRLRYNAKLFAEYQKLVRRFRNDVIQSLFAMLDDADRAVRVPRSTLSRRHHELATKRCRWPSHDQHLLAAALGGDDPSIIVTEERLARCAPAVHSSFAVRVRQL